MGLMDLLTSKMEDDKKKSPLYTFHVKDEADEVVFMWYVVDANHGYTVFSYQRPQERHTQPIFQQWFMDKNEAIEFAVDQGRAEKLAKGL